MASKRIRKTPISKAKNAYKLLDEVCEVILAEPRRYNQEDWLIKGLPGEKTWGAKRGLPECGTVGCVAGWVYTLKGAGTLSGTNTLTGKALWRVADDAQAILGLSAEQAAHFFRASAIQDLAHKLNRPVPRPQTVAYARLGVKHIRAFQKTHAEQLKAKKV